MIRSCVTVSLVPEARGGPFVFWDDLAGRLPQGGSSLGFDAIEIFPPEPEAIEAEPFAGCSTNTGLKLAAIGTGAGWVRHKSDTCACRTPGSAPRPANSSVASSTAAGRSGASAIIGSMQGRGDAVDRPAALGYLAEALDDLGDHARQVRRAAVLRTAQSLRNESGQLARRRRRNCSSSLKTDNVQAAGRSVPHEHRGTDIADGDSRSRRSASAMSISSIPIAGRPVAATSTSRRSPPPCATSATTAMCPPRRCPIPTATTAARLTIDAYRTYFRIARDKYVESEILCHAETPAAFIRTINEVLGRAGHHAKMLIADGNYPASTARGLDAEVVCLTCRRAWSTARRC